MEGADSNYLEALSEVYAQSKSIVAIATVPLALVLVQLRYLATVDSFWLQTLATVAVVSLFLAALLAWVLVVNAGSTYAMELYRRDDRASRKGNTYMHQILKMAKDENAYTERWYVEQSKPLVKPFFVFLGVGYCTLFLFIILLIWSNPSDERGPLHEMQQNSDADDTNFGAARIHA